MATYTYDLYGNVSEVKRGNTAVLKNFADSIGNIIRTQDMLTNLEHRISYDYIGRPISKEVLDLSVANGGDSWLRSVEYNYDVNNNLTRFAYADRHGSNVTSYTYTDDNLLETTTLNNGKVLTNTHDNLGRLIGKTLNTADPINTVYTYHNSKRGTVGDKAYTTTKIETEETPAFGYKYRYDDLGNITAVYTGVKGANGKYTYNSKPDIEYVYDDYGQLTTVNDYANSEQYEYVYNSAGNITRRYHYAINDSWVTVATLENVRYTYGDSQWKDLLTSYGGQTITYDAIGNPLNYRDGIQLTWQNGRELATFEKESEGIEVTYTYDAGGMRTQKDIRGIGEVYYVYEGGLLMQMDYLGYIFNFSYDVNGSPIGFRFTNDETGLDTYYYYGLNSRGDVIALYDAGGTQIASYTYDAYGKPIDTTVISDPTGSGNGVATRINPLRYRGYVYDNETGFYYLQSRYYDPTTCRFVNADSYISTGQGLIGYNMFAYCLNNPIMLFDSTGKIGLIAAIFAGVAMITIILLVPSSEKQEATQSQIQEAEEAAKRADLSVRNDQSGKATIDIHIDTEDALNSVDNIASSYYYQSLYDRTVEKANEIGMPTDNLMSAFHINWEFNAHAIGYYLGIDNCFQTDLNIEETPLTMIMRAIGW